MFIAPFGDLPEIQFNNFEEVEGGKLWYQKLRSTTADGQVEIIKLERDAILAPHFHRNSKSKIIVVAGVGIAMINNEREFYEPGKMYYIDYNNIHGFKASDETILIVFSTAPTANDTIIVEDDRRLHESLYVVVA